ncbi:MAG: hypothetical protein NTW31_08070, partial [Bacteroidetes bacterium]|nr:hypothetical protein [Bacteroidota bacterium]
MVLHSPDTPNPVPPRKRPFFLEVLCIFCGVYFFAFSVLLISGFFFSGWVSNAINLYTPVKRFSGIEIKMILGAYALLFILAFSGIILMWKLRKYGYYIFGVSSLLLASFQMAFPGLTFSGTIIFIAFLVLFGLYF